MWNLKNHTDEIISKTERDSQAQKTSLWLPKGKVGREGGINWEFGININILLYIKQSVNKDLLYSTGNSTQHSVIMSMRRKPGKEWIYV